jgi:hypothetical protein
MADGVNQEPGTVHSADEHAAETAAPARLSILRQRSAGLEPSPHAHMFRRAMVLLAGLAVGAIAIAIAIASNHSGGGPAQKWSQWAPLDSGNQGATEIADHIAPLYRLSGIDQLAVVTVVNLGNPNDVNPSTGSLSGLQVAVRTDGQSTGSGLSLLNGKTIAYNLCGIGSSNCAIGIGKSSAARLLLLKREGLELALYTFKYISGTDNVVAILPPGHVVEDQLTATPRSTPKTKPLDLALLFERQELQPFLEQPLSETLPEQVPPTIREMPLWQQTNEASLVAQITERGEFSEQLEQAQDGTHLILLDQQPPS